MASRRFSGDPEINEKTRQNDENKQTLDLSGKLKLSGKTRQYAEKKQTLNLTGIILLCCCVICFMSHLLAILISQIVRHPG